MSLYSLVNTREGPLEEPVSPYHLRKVPQGEIRQSGRVSDVRIMCCLPGSLLCHLSDRTGKGGVIKLTKTFTSTYTYYLYFKVDLTGYITRQTRGTLELNVTVLIPHFVVRGYCSRQRETNTFVH